MASQHQILEEIQAWGLANPGLNPLDGLRRQKIAALKALTGRPLLIYAADFLSMKAATVPQLQTVITINLRDKDFLAGVVEAIPGDELDLLIQSPGGSAEAVEIVVEHLRSRFRHIRVLIPGTAKSAATMLALSADELVMDGLSECGPTDPQVPINGRFNPAGAIIKQFDLAVESLREDPSQMSAWLPVLQMYGPALIVECRHYLELSQRLVAKWLAQYMFKDERKGETMAANVAEWLSEDDNFLTHARRVNIQELRSYGVRVHDMAQEPNLQVAVRDVYYAIMATFDSSGCYKLFENSEGTTVAQNIMAQTITQQPVPTHPVPANN